MATKKQLMTILSKIGVTEAERRDLVLEWTHGRTNSVRGLTPDELSGLCTTLSQRQQQVTKELDKKRKRVIAAVFGMYEKMNKKVSMAYVIGTICRRAKVDDINKIPSARLDSLYNAYLQAQKDLNFTRRITGSWI
ncbi:MAG: hypothetical protein RR906_08495, partial [Acetivibrio sp.]